MDLAAGYEPARGLSLPPGLPTRGLEEILGGWSSAGQALDALDSIIDERDWRPGMVGARLHRLLVADLVAGPLRGWPVLTATWLEALPATSVVHREIGSRARAVDWKATARMGWPPVQLATRPRRRDDDHLLTGILRWTLERLDHAVVSARKVWTEVDASARPQIAAALDLLDLSPVAETRSLVPDRSDLDHIAAEGHPWNLLAPAAAELLRYEQTSPASLGALIAPEDQWRLYHLGVLGELVAHARDTGRHVRSVGPIAGGAPCYSIDDMTVWFEGGKLAGPRPYTLLSGHAHGKPKPLAADIVVLRHDEGLLIECKWYADGTRAVRDGLRAAMAYALDAKPAALAEVISAAVLPDSQVDELGATHTSAGTVAIAGVRHVGKLLDNFASATASWHPAPP